MYFELARMFPAFRPHEIPLLPFSYFRRMRDYYVETRRAEAEAFRSAAPADVIEFEGPLDG